MANEKNLIPFDQRTKKEQREIRSAGGRQSGRARREKADLRKAAQAYLESTCTNERGETVTGIDMIMSAIEQVVNDPNSKNWAAAVKTMLTLTGADISETELRKQKEELKRQKRENERLKEEIELIKARTAQVKAAGFEGTDAVDDGFVEALKGRGAEVWNNAQD